MKTLKIVLCKSSFAGPVSGADEILLNYALMLDIYQRVAGNSHAANAIASSNGNRHPWAESSSAVAFLANGAGET